MNVFRKIIQRIYTFVFYKFTYLMNFREPQVISGENALLKIPELLNELKLNNLFIVVDPTILKLGLIDNLLKELDNKNLKYTIFDIIEPNPKIKDIEKGVSLYKDSFSNSILTIGGGSAMDTAKAIGARIARPNKSIEQLGGLLKVGKKIPTLIAVPTTAGTGSETTIASVVTNEVTHHKYSINDLHLIPSYAVLDPVLTLGLPKSITAMTGMDALTHAVEGYISMDVPKKYQKLAIESIKSIFSSLEDVYNDGSNIKKREEMLNASFKAGVVFTRVGLTYVHPIAHALGGLYNVPHGLANACVLPYCLRYYGKSVYKKLAHLSIECGLSDAQDTIEEASNKFIEKIESMNDLLGLTRKFDIKEEDIKTMCDWAYKEANSAYYPPVLLGKDEIKEIILMIKA